MVAFQVECTPSNHGGQRVDLLGASVSSSGVGGARFRLPHSTRRRSLHIGLSGGRGDGDCHGIASIHTQLPIIP